MTEMLIRAARLEDAEGIAKAHVMSWRETYAGIVPEDYLHNLSVEKRRESWREILQAGAPAAGLLVAEDRAGIAGFASFGPAWDAAMTADFGCQGELYALYLLRRAQRQGHGRKLFEAAQNCLKSVGLRGLYLWVLRDNRTLEFYRHLGGSECRSKTLEIGGKALEEVALGWEAQS